MVEQKEWAACPVCGSTRVSFVHRHTEFGLEFDRCADCNFHFATHPIPPLGDLELVEGMDDWPEYIEGLRGDDAVRLRALSKITELLDRPGEHPDLFDVGAGVGDFVKLAAERGFTATGNDLSQRGVDLALERNGLALSIDPLDRQPSECTDVITMWCVLAHVDDPGAFLRECRRMLRPDGVLFLRTPGWSIADRYGFTMARLSKGRFVRMADRRLNTAHMFLYNRRNLEMHLQAAGFKDITIERVCHYPFRTTWYLHHLGGVLGKGLRPVASGLDALIDRNLFVRNTMFVWARPDPDAQGPGLAAGPHADRSERLPAT